VEYFQLIWDILVERSFPCLCKWWHHIFRMWYH